MLAFPLSAALISLVCAAIALGRYLTRHRPHELAWGISFSLFALGAFAEVAGDLIGWTPLLTRLYYLSGAVLTVAFLGMGSLYLLLGRRLERWGPGIMLALAIGGASFVFTTPVDPEKLDQGWQALAVRGTPTLPLTIFLNTAGTLIVVGGALYSIAVGRRRGLPRDRALGLLLIAAGTLVVASGGTLVRAFGNHAYLYLTMAPGVAIILAGYLLANRVTRGAPVAPVAAAPADETTAPLPRVQPQPQSQPQPTPPPPPPTGAGVPAGHASVTTRLAPPSASVPPPPPALAVPTSRGSAVVAPTEQGGGAAQPFVAESPRTSAPPPLPVVIRPLARTDAAALRELLGCCAALAPLAALVRYEPDEAIAALLARPESTWLGAVHEARLVGVARLLRGSDPASRHTARLGALAVHPEVTGRGVGTALLREATQWADSVLGLARLDTWVPVDEQRVIDFYRRHGFQPEGVARQALFFAGRHQDMLVLARTPGRAGG